MVPDIFFFFFVTDPDDFEEYELGEHRSVVNSDPDAQIQVSYTEMRAMVQRIKAAEDRAKHFKEELHNSREMISTMQYVKELNFTYGVCLLL